MLASYERMFGSKPKTTKITSPSVKGDHPKIDDSPFLRDEEIQQYRSLIGQFQWAISLGRFDIAVAIMTMSSIRSAPRLGHLDRLKRISGFLSKMRHSGIRIHTEEPDFSISQRQSMTGNSLYTEVPKKRSRRMHPYRWVNLWSPQLILMLTCIIVCSQTDRLLEFSTSLIRPPPTGMLKSKDRQRQLPMVPNLLLREQQQSKLSIIR